MRPSLLCRVFIVAVFPLLPLHAQRAESSGGFVTTLGRDTIAVERFARYADRIEGDVAIRNPRTRTIHYSARLGPKGTVTKLDMTSRVAVASTTAPYIIERYTTIDDTVIVTEVKRSGVRDTVASGRTIVPKSGAVPFIQSSTVFAEQMVQQLLRAKVDSLEIPQFTFGPNHAFASYVRRLGKDSMDVNVGAPGYAKIDASGRLLGLSARASTVKTETVRVPSVDFDDIVRGWIEAENRGEIPGAVSARDTARATLGTADLWIDYGRPLKRGRAIFGALVPFDTVWRTGANAATQFRTSVDLRIGDQVVPAGTYTLWSIPMRNGATLIINKQVGQWGTQYDKAQDLVHVPMMVERVSAPVERMTVEIVPKAGGAQLSIVWDDRRFTVPIRTGGKGAPREREGARRGADSVEPESAPTAPQRFPEPSSSRTKRPASMTPLRTV